MRRTALSLTLTCVLMFPVFIAGCGKPKIESGWLSRKIDIDGKFEDWHGEFVYYNKDMRVSVGVANDDTFLYLCLVTRNRGLAEEIKHSGFTVWFDPEAKSKKVFGVRFPVCVQDRDMPAGPGRKSPPGVKDTQSEREEIPRGPWRQVEIIGPGKKERYTASLEEIEKDGIKVEMGVFQGQFIHELKVPLVESVSHPYYIGAGSGFISMGFETSERVGGMRGGRMPGGGPGGGMRMPDRGMPEVGGMGMPGGMRGGPGRGMAGSDNNFNLWVKVMLASAEVKK